MRTYCKILRLSACLFVLLFLSSVGYTSSPQSTDVHFCLPLDLSARDSSYVAPKQTFNLNVGEPRTVRMIYFLPNDRPFRQEVVDSMKVTIRQIQAFFAEQMQAHGYGNKTFRFETDAQGEPMVLRVEGQHPTDHYLGGSGEVDEIEQKFDLSANNVYLIVLDNGTDEIKLGIKGVGIGGRNSGIAKIPGEFHWKTAAHELGHGFGLGHNFNDDAYIMSYGYTGQDRLSPCYAKFLAVHPYFNSDVPDEETPPTIQLTSQRAYTKGSKSVPIQLKVSDLDGLHQVLLFTDGVFNLKACHGLNGEQDAVVEFDYDGRIPSNDGTGLSNPLVHQIYVKAVDTGGNVTSKSFNLWEVSPQYIATLEGHTDQIRSLAYSPDGTLLASGSWDRKIKLWDVATRTNTATLEGHTGWVSALAFSPNGTVLVSGAWDRTVKLWDVVTEKNIDTLEEHTAWVNSVVFSRDGTLLASGAGNTIKLWDVATWTDTATLVHTDFVYSVVFSPDGTTLASGSWDNTIRLWDVARKKNSFTLEGHTSVVFDVAFSPDGTILASGWGEVKLWDVMTQKNIATIKDYGSVVSSLAFSPDGGVLAVGLEGGEIQLLDVATGQNIVALRGPRVQSVAFSPYSTTLASGAEDGTILLWDMSEYITPVVNIPDANLRAVIRDALDKSRFAPVTTTDMASLPALDASNRNIRDLTGLEFATNLTRLNLTDNPLSSSSINTHIPALKDRGVEVLFDKPTTPDFDGDGVVGIADFLLFVEQFGFSEDDAGYDARFDLDGNGVIGIGDFLIFVDNFGKEAALIGSSGG